MNFARRIVYLWIVGALLSACAANQQPELIASNKSAVELRAMQSRMFETGDKNRIVRAIIATLLDLGYSIEKVEPEVGTVTGEKLTDIRLTASAYPRGSERTIVRTNAIVQILTDARTYHRQGYQIDAPEFYQKWFFDPLSKALFLTALQVEDNVTVPTVEVPSKTQASPQNRSSNSSSDAAQPKRGQ